MAIVIFIIFIISLMDASLGVIEHDIFWITVAFYEMLIVIFMKIVDKESK